MAKKRVKKSRIKILCLCLFTFILVSYSLMELFSVWKQILLTKEKKEFYTKELARLEEEEEYLKVEVEKLQDPDYVARYAREQYLYSRDGEFNIRIN